MSQEVGNEIKRIANGLISSLKIGDYEVGTVTDPSGPIIQLEGNQGPLPAAAVSVPDYLRKYSVEVSGAVTGTLEIDNSLKAGDKVYVLRKTGGQKFLIIGRI